MKCARTGLLAVLFIPSLLSAQRQLTATLDWEISMDREQLSDIGPLIPSRTGLLAVFQSQDGKVLVYGPDGKRLASMGRKGSGPGGFQQPFIWSSWHGDTLVVMDLRLSRFTLFSSSGKLLSTASFDQFTLRPPPGTQTDKSGIERYTIDYLGPDELLSAITIPAARPIPSWLPLQGKRTAVVVSKMDGTYQRIVATIDYTRETDPCLIQTGTMSGIPFCRAMPLNTISAPRGMVRLIPTTTDTRHNGYRFVVVNSHTGASITTREFIDPAIAIPRAVKDSVVKPPVVGAGGGSRGGVPNQKAPKLPDTYPAVKRVMVGLDMSIWYQDYAASSGERWRVLDSKGAPMGTVIFPAGFRLTAAQLDLAWGVMPQHDGNENIRRYRIR